MLISADIFWTSIRTPCGQSHSSCKGLGPRTSTTREGREEWVGPVPWLLLQRQQEGGATSPSTKEVRDRMQCSPVPVQPLLQRQPQRQQRGPCPGAKPPQRLDGVQPAVPQPSTASHPASRAPDLSLPTTGWGAGPALRTEG